MDLGLDEYRQDLLRFYKDHPEIEKLPHGLHCVVPASSELPEGFIFVLKNINSEVNIDKKNQIHPFYMVYIDSEGEVICNHLKPRKMLDDIRLLCRDQKEPIPEKYKLFNQETLDGKQMDEVSDLLQIAIESIVEVNEESDIDSLFSPGGTTALLSEISGLNDFELLYFIAVK